MSSKKSIFPITVKGIKFYSFRSIDSHFGLPYGRTYKRYTRDGLRGDRLAEPLKRWNNIQERKVKIDGVVRTVKEWLDANKIKTKTFYSRFYENGWSIVRAVTIPTGKLTGRNIKGLYIEWKGKTYRAIDLAKLSMVSYPGFLNRLRRGWPIDKIMSTPNVMNAPTVKKVFPIRSSIRKMAMESGKGYSVILNRLRSGWTKDEAMNLDIHDRSVSIRKRRNRQLAALGIIN